MINMLSHFDLDKEMEKIYQVFMIGLVGFLMGRYEIISNNEILAKVDDVYNAIETIGSRMVEKDLNQQPTIKIRRGSRFNIFVNTDMVLPVYSGRN